MIRIKLYFLCWLQNNLHISEYIETHSRSDGKHVLMRQQITFIPSFPWIIHERILSFQVSVRIVQHPVILRSHFFSSSVKISKCLNHNTSIQRAETHFPEQFLIFNIEMSMRWHWRASQQSSWSVSSNQSLKKKEWASAAMQGLKSAGEKAPPIPQKQLLNGLRKRRWHAAVMFHPLRGETRRRGRFAVTWKTCKKNPKKSKLWVSIEAPWIHLNAHSDAHGPAHPQSQSGPALSPLPAAWDGWWQIPALRVPLSKRNGGKKDRGEMKGETKGGVRV